MMPCLLDAESAKSTPAQVTTHEVNLCNVVRSCPLSGICPSSGIAYSAGMHYKSVSRMQDAPDMVYVLPDPVWP